MMEEYFEVIRERLERVRGILEQASNQAPFRALTAQLLEELRVLEEKIMAAHNAASRMPSVSRLLSDHAGYESAVRTRKELLEKIRDAEDGRITKTDLMFGHDQETVSRFVEGARKLGWIETEKEEKSWMGRPAEILRITPKGRDQIREDGIYLESFPARRKRSSDET